ncbi:MAG: hypothetical protein AAF268_15860 [Cyanobacteria bacterium P01_A01_bin.3]
MQLSSTGRESCESAHNRIRVFPSAIAPASLELHVRPFPALPIGSVLRTHKFPQPRRILSSALGSDR